VKQKCRTNGLQTIRGQEEGDILLGGNCTISHDSQQNWEEAVTPLSHLNISGLCNENMQERNQEIHLYTRCYCSNVSEDDTNKEFSERFLSSVEECVNIFLRAFTIREILGSRQLLSSPRVQNPPPSPRQSSAIRSVSHKFLEHEHCYSPWRLSGGTFVVSVRENIVRLKMRRCFPHKNDFSPKCYFVLPSSRLCLGWIHKHDGKRD
jgi:hypothetical protein